MITLNEIVDWLEKWLAIFPPDHYVATDGYVRGKASTDLVKKMQKFCKANPTYTKETIFAATRMYVLSKKPVNFAYIKRPIYFIHKQTEGSLLEAYCEKVLAGETTTEHNEYNPSSEFL